MRSLKVRHNHTAIGNSLALVKDANSSLVARTLYSATEFVASRILYGCSPVM